eukprot:1685513-Prorocentrum_lima.AAC.1
MQMLRDGRVCVLCGEKDTAADPVKPDEFLHWRYAPRVATSGSLVVTFATIAAVCTGTSTPACTGG